MTPGRLAFIKDISQGDDPVASYIARELIAEVERLQAHPLWLSCGRCGWAMQVLQRTVAQAADTRWKPHDCLRCGAPGQREKEGLCEACERIVQCDRCGGSGKDPEQEGPCGECCKTEGWDANGAPVGGTPRGPELDEETRRVGCQCHLEVGDSPCRVHGLDEETKE